jgi:hypothetical protein
MGRVHGWEARGLVTVSSPDEDDAEESEGGGAEPGVSHHFVIALERHIQSGNGIAK